MATKKKVKISKTAKADFKKEKATFQKPTTLREITGSTDLPWWEDPPDPDKSDSKEKMQTDIRIDNGSQLLQPTMSKPMVFVTKVHIGTGVEYQLQLYPDQRMDVLFILGRYDNFDEATIRATMINRWAGAE